VDEVLNNVKPDIQDIMDYTFDPKNYFKVVSKDIENETFKDTRKFPIYMSKTEGTCATNFNVKMMVAKPEQNGRYSRFAVDMMSGCVRLLQQALLS